ASPRRRRRVPQHRGGHRESARAKPLRRGDLSPLHSPALATARPIHPDNRKHDTSEIMNPNLVREPTSMATLSPNARRRAGAAIRRDVPRSAQGEWAPSADRTDPVEILIEQGKNRIQELLPIRYG